MDPVLWSEVRISPTTGASLNGGQLRGKYMCKQKQSSSYFTFLRGRHTGIQKDQYTKYRRKRKSITCSTCQVQSLCARPYAHSYIRANMPCIVSTYTCQYLGYD